MQQYIYEQVMKSYWPLCYLHALPNMVVIPNKLQPSTQIENYNFFYSSLGFITFNTTNWCIDNWEQSLQLYLNGFCLQFLHNFQFFYFSKHEIFIEWNLKQRKVGAAFNSQSFVINMSTMNLWKSLLFFWCAFRKWDAIALLSMSKLIIWFACTVFFTWRKKSNSLYSNDALRTGERT